MVRRLVLIALLFVVAGCGQKPTESDTVTPEAAMPDDFVGEVSYGNGSVAPPYHYEWLVEFDTSTARLTWSPGYEDAETWTETVDLTETERARFHNRLSTAGLFEFTEDDDGLVGGPTGHATFGSLYDGPLGTSEAGQDMLDKVVAATEELFPAQVWADMEQRQSDWEDQQPK